MKRAILQITDQFLVDVAQGCMMGPPRSFKVIRNALPSDAKPIRSMIMNNGLLGILIESYSFDDVEEGEEYPTLDLPVIEVKYG